MATVLPHNNVVLAWDPAADKQTTNSKGLYYNLRVGTNPGGMELFSPEADLVTGKRRVADFGNAGHTNRWLLSNLHQGTYYWSVQAIDTALAGGPFSEERSFIITNDVDFTSNHPPFADPQTISLAEDTYVPVTLTGTDPDEELPSYAIMRYPSHGTLRGFAPNLAYYPFTNYFGQDSFDFRASDGLATSPAATVTINVSPVPDVADVTVSLQNFPFYPVVVITGEPYEGYILQASSNLVDWVPIDISTNAASSSGHNVDINSSPWKFFRARTVP
jgi:hypothetical protein